MRSILLIFSVATMFACGSKQAKENEKLPFMGRQDIVDGKVVNHTIADFKFVDQDSNWVSSESLSDKIYIADFFFTSCPTICPLMKAQMLRVYEQIKDDPEVVIVSHTIDPKHDTVALLKAFAEKLGVTSDKWHFVTGDKETIYKLGQTSYMVSAVEDPNEPGGYVHSGAFILVDKNRHVRGLYDGTKPEKVDLLLKDLEILKAEQ